MKDEPWPKKGGMVWVAELTHTHDAYDNNQYIPIQRMVTSVGTDTVHLVGAADRKIEDCFISRTLCEMHLPAPHPDP